MPQRTRSIVYVSDDLDHDKTTVLVFLIKLLVDLTRSEGVQRIDIFSDRPLSQFKNQYVFNCLPMLFQRNGLDHLNWHLFAMSHGEGAVDGIGGTVKRNVWMEALSRKVVVNSLEEFCSVANKKDKNVEVPPYYSKAIKKIAEEINLQELFAASRPINGIKKKHFVSVLQNGQFLCKDYSKQGDEDELAQPLQPSEDDLNESEANNWYNSKCERLAPHTNVTVGDFIICQYEEELFPGRITSIHPDGKGAHVMGMQKWAVGWRWPKKRDEIDYLEEDIIDKTEYPAPVNNRGTYKVPELEKKWGN